MQFWPPDDEHMLLEASGIITTIGVMIPEAV